ncbi:hypothetical protein DM02DRAFT_670 [Periconia macrospinosa]|uniref:Uncharacterized protein n=1 Tax=Periconia macrospinosa TaxID=97972 RepID=A0A2V1ED95_9PLEO|nr:hypothetical protein DM02DRAFT_670 [Periconia macrospinosa]
MNRVHDERQEGRTGIATVAAQPPVAAAARPPRAAAAKPKKPTVFNTQHYKRARQEVKENPDNARWAVTDIVNEPAYAFTDIELSDAIKHLKNLMLRFVERNIKFAPGKNNDLEKVFSGLTPETTRLIGYIASGGPEGEYGWKRFFLHNQDEMYDEDGGENKKGQALALGIIGKVIAEQVWGHACFGADTSILNDIQDIEKRLKDFDGEFSLLPPPSTDFWIILPCLRLPRNIPKNILTFPPQVSNATPRESMSLLNISSPNPASSVSPPFSPSTSPPSPQPSGNTCPP